MHVIFAAEDWYVAVGTAIGVVLAALFAGALKLLNWWTLRGERQSVAAEASRKTSLDEWREIVTRQDLMIDVYRESNDACRGREMTLQRNVTMLHGIVCHQNSAMKTANMAVDDVPPLEAMLPDDPSLEVKRRQLEQNARLVKAEAVRVKQDSDVPARPSSGAV